jgi:uncharacterized Fe-S radical SAM superfamily protein PflX
MIYTIKKEEVLDYVQTMHSYKILEILEKIKKHCYENGIPLINNPSNNMDGEFVELILDCLDINMIYSNNNKISK